MTLPLVLLDRDGVLNALVVDAEQGTIDSPLHPSQVELLPGVAEALLQVQGFGYDLAIVTNQPAAAKGKTTRANLQAVHERVIELAEQAGARVRGSYICYHRSEDGCHCRKPQPGLLEEALMGADGATRRRSWMVGDGLSDLEAGARAGIRTAFLGPHKLEHQTLMAKAGLRPDFWGVDLRAFANYLRQGPAER
jgi:histidinol-phosphate phosphatase family protein